MTREPGRAPPRAEYIMRDAGLDEAQVGIKITRRNISNLRYADDTTLGASLVAQRLPCSALKGETVPDSLPATPKSPPTRRVPPRGPLYLTSATHGSPSRGLYVNPQAL